MSLQWAKTPRWILEHPDLTDLDVRVYGWLAWAASPNRITRQSIRTIGKAIHRDERAVRKSLRRLETHAALTLTEQNGRAHLIAVHDMPIVDAAEPLPQRRLFDHDAS